MTSLAERRERGYMIETFRTKGFNRVNKEKWFTFRDSNSSRATQSTDSVTDDQQHAREDVLFMSNVNVAPVTLHAYILLLNLN